MADEDIDDELGGEEGGASSKSKHGGALGGLIPTILKFVALGLGAVILIVTVVIITMNIMGANKPQAQAIPISEDYKEIAEELEWYQSLGEIQTRSIDPIPASISVNIFMGYKKDDKITSTEITAQRIPIRDFLRNYFAGKTAEELSPRNEERIKIEIRNEINDTILNRGKIRRISFDTLRVVSQQ